MTFVAAKRFGERVLIASDTMISHRTGTRHDVIPGRLKAIILDAQTTVAYAGLPDQGVDAIKRAKQFMSGGGTLSDVEQTLVAATEEHLGKLEFLIVSHHNGVALKRIWDGRISACLDQACIGQRDLLSQLLEQEAQHPVGVVPHEFEYEAPFSFAFRKLFNGLHVSDSVGGFGVTVTCSPYGHCYPPFGGVAAWDTIRGGQALTEQQLANRRSGMTQWGYNISGPKLRGVGVVGAIILDAGIGYIYAPLHKEEPIQWSFSKPTEQKQHGPVLEEFQRQIDQVANKVGGGIEVTFPPPSSRSPTEIELQQIVAYAAAAVLPTQVSLEAEAIWISCGTSIAWRRVQVGFSSLDPDPVWVLTAAIDRLNAEVGQQLRQAEANAANRSTPPLPAS